MAWTERYVRDDAAGGGNGTTDTNSGANGAWTLAEAVSNEGAGMRLNVRAGTYASTTSSRTLAAAGTTTAPIWWRGFNTTPGDCDADPTLPKPLLTWTTGRLGVTGAHHILSNLSVQSGFATGNAFNVSVAVRLDRCRIENTNAAAASRAINVSTAGCRFHRCWFKATTTATSAINTSAQCAFEKCVFEGGGHGLDVTTAAIAMTVQGCVFRGNGGDGINIGTAGNGIMTVQGCTFYGCGSDGIEFATVPNYFMGVSDCIFANCGGYGINNSTGTNTNSVHRSNNLFYSNTSGNENGFGDSPSFSEQADSSSPFVNAAGGDLSLVSTSNAKANGSPAPGIFENQSYASYLDIGAVQRQEPAGGGGTTYLGVSRSRLVNSGG